MGWQEKLEARMALGLKSDWGQIIERLEAGLGGWSPTTITEERLLRILQRAEAKEYGRKRSPVIMARIAEIANFLDNRGIRS